MDIFFSLPPIWQGFIATLFCYFMTAAGAGMVFFIRGETNGRVMNFILSASAGIMLAAAFLSLLLPAMELSAELGLTDWLVVSGGFCVGGLFVFMCDFIPICGHGEKRPSALLTLAVTLHNIPEGLAVGVAFGSVAVGVPEASVSGAIALALGIGLQNFTEGLCVAMPLAVSAAGETGKAKRRAFFIGQASGLVEIAAGCLGVLFAISVRLALPFALSFACGAMVIVVVAELIPSFTPKHKRAGTLGCIFGFVLMMILDIALG